MSFHEVLDDVFDKLCKTYGANNIDLVKHKQKLYQPKRKMRQTYLFSYILKLCFK